MLSMTRPTETRDRFPWEEGRACPEDRALGIELELIELVHQREVADADRDVVHVREIDEQIDATMDDLVAVAASAAAAYGEADPTAG